MMPSSHHAATPAELATRQWLDAQIADGSTPGLQYLFVSADRVLFEHNGGTADPRRQRPVTEHTTFNAYSITKTFTAAAVLQLAELGRIDLDLPIARYLERRPQAGAATVWQTLLHRAGFANPNPMRWVHLVDGHLAFDQARFIDQVLIAHGRPVSMPGKHYAYSNVGYLLLGELIETVSGLRYEQYVQQHLIAPLSLSEGEVLAYEVPQPQDHARGHLRRFGWLNLLLRLVVDRDRLVDASVGRWVQFRNHQVNGAAYGGLVGNARGLARYLQALLAGCAIFSPATQAQLFSTVAGPGPGRSVGWFSGRLNREPWFAHAGGAAGYYSEVRVYPGLGRASVVMFNRTGIRDERILDRIDRHLVASSR